MALSPPPDHQNNKRLFVALPVPTHAAAKLDALPLKGIDARWTSSADYHITLRFLGDVAPDRLPDIVAALRRVRRTPFGIEVRGLGVFEKDRQSILHAHIESVRKVTTLCADITDVLTPLGFDFGPRPFTPHVTLARCKNSAAPANYASKYGKSLRIQWDATSFALMESGGIADNAARYSVLESFSLIS